MKYEAHPDVAVLVGKPAEEDAGSYGGERLRHRLAEMDHAIRNGHHKDRVNAERWFEAVQQKPAKEEFEPEELKEVDYLPE